MVEIKRNQKGNFDVLSENTEVGKIEMMNETDIAYRKCGRKPTAVSAPLVLAEQLC
jgi:hypothetical protein